VVGIYLPVAPTITSDANLKENFVVPNEEEVLQKLVVVPVSSWNLKGHNAQQNRHYGPMAQDFYAAFGRDGYGTIGSDTTINTHDLTSINTLAIQALEKRSRKYEELIKENESLKQEIQLLKTAFMEENATLREMVNALAKQMALNMKQ